MKYNPFNPKVQSGKVKLPVAPIGNGTIVKTAFKYSDTTYYQIGPSGDYQQETN